MELATDIDILVGDDHRVIYQGVEAMLARREGIKQLDYAGSIEDIKHCLVDRHYDLLILDLNIAGTNSLDHIEQFRALAKNLKIIIFSSYNNKKLVIKAQQLQVNGYLLKSTDEENFNAALIAVMKGEAYFSLSDTEDGSKQQHALKFMHIAELSAREKELASLIVSGNNEQELAELLFISKNTVRTHKKNIFRKLNVSGTFGLIKYIQANSEVF
jgi:DNA-binding NarL/FixJ family response regulator